MPSLTDRHFNHASPSIGVLRATASGLHRQRHQLVYISVHEEEAAMRTTVNLDEALLAAAQKMSGVTERSALIHAGLRALIERESARRLARLGGSESQLKPIRRRRPRS